MTVSISACGAAVASPTRSAGKAPVATPAGTASATLAAVPLPAPPYSVLVTNAARQGSTYDVILLDALARVVTRTSAHLPLLKPNQTINTPLVSVSRTLVYYLDGDTDIHSLAPNGDTMLVKTISAGRSSTIAFAVSPDDKRIAVSVIAEAADTTRDAGHGYVEDLADAGQHVDLFDNTGADALRWPAAWHGNSIIDSVGSQCGGYGNSVSVVCAPASYHVIDPGSGGRTGTICETPNPQPPGESSYLTLSGLPVGAGIACAENEYYSTGSSSAKLLSVDWAGHETTFVTAGANGAVPYSNCFLAPSGALMACAATTSAALTMVSVNGAVHGIGRRYSVLGWLDDNHLVVDIDSNTLGVLTADTASMATLSIVGADRVSMGAGFPGSL